MTSRLEKRVKRALSGIDLSGDATTNTLKVRAALKGVVSLEDVQSNAKDYLDCIGPSPIG
jgi:hypothetical protein